jgi:hypothetical protein
MRKEYFSVHVLSVGSGIRAGKLRKLHKVLKFFLSTPATIVADRYFASAAMHNGAYTVANSGLPGDGLAHNVTCAQTAVDAEDTNGILTFTGIDVDGKVITENLVPNDGATVQGLKAFKQVTSIVGSGWTAGGGADTIVIGFGEVVGLPDIIDSTSDVLMLAHNTALVNAPTVTQDANVLSKNTVTVPTGDGTKKLRVLYQV